MNKTLNYGLIIIGSGSGGLVAAQTAKKLGAKVALVERNERLGGECLHAGCVPSKSLIAAARAAHNARQAGQYGVRTDVIVDFEKVKKHIEGAINAIEEAGENDQHYADDLGIPVYHGAAKFIDANTIRVGDDTLRAKKFIIATGSSPLIPSIPGIEDVQYETNESIFTMPEFPKRLTVIGGGPIGCELGQAFAQLGSKVTIINNGDRLLPRDAQEVSGAISNAFKKQGITVLYNAKIEAPITQNENGIHLKVTTADGSVKTVDADNLLIATGRLPNIDMDLKNAGIETTERGIKVNKQLQTTNKNVYAVGDCVGQYQFTHFAADQAILAVKNTLYPFRQKMAARVVPWTTFTTPEVAQLGAIEDELIKNKTPHKTYRIDYAEIDKAIVANEAGSIKIMTDAKSEKILGATIIGENAGELMAQVCLVYNQDQNFSELAHGMRAYPSYAIALKQLAGNAILSRTSENRLLKLIKRV